MSVGFSITSAGKSRPLPRWIRRVGLEWLFILTLRPGRFWKRYIIGFPVLALLIMRAWFLKFASWLLLKDWGLKRAFYTFDGAGISDFLCYPRTRIWEILKLFKFQFDGASFFK